MPRFRVSAACFFRQVLGKKGNDFAVADLVEVDVVDANSSERLRRTEADDLMTCSPEVGPSEAGIFHF